MASVSIENGQIIDTSASKTSLSATRGESGSSLGKDDFLNLLVAQMKYQDPLEPTSNTEYISQMATFSELEQMQNLNSTMTDNHASSLVGKQVILKVTSETTGETQFISGQVDYIVRENGKTYLSVNDGLYSVDDLDTVVDETYLDAVTVVDVFHKLVDALPSKNNLTINHQEALEKIREALDSMSDYEKGFVKSDAVKLLEELEERMEELKAIKKRDELKEKVGKLPEVDKITLDNKAAIEEARKLYDSMTDAQKGFVDKDVLEALEAAEAKIKELGGTSTEEETNTEEEA